MGNGAIGSLEDAMLESVLIDLAIPLKQLDVEGLVTLYEGIFLLNRASDDSSVSTANEFASLVDQFLCREDAARFAEFIERLSESYNPDVRASVLPALESFERIDICGDTDETGAAFEVRIRERLLNDSSQHVVDQAGQSLTDRMEGLDGEDTHDLPQLRALADTYL